MIATMSNETQEQEQVHTPEVVRETEQPMDAIIDDIRTSEKRDYVAAANRIKLSLEDSNKVELRMYPTQDFEGTDYYNFSMNTFAQQQMTTRLAPGFSTFSKWLRQENMFPHFVRYTNDLLDNEPSSRRFQVRTIARNGQSPEGHTARAILSDSYKTIDDDLIFGTAMPIIGQHSDKFKAIGGQRTDTNTYMKIVTRDPVITIRSGNKERAYSAGFMLKNSEVGCGYCEFLAFMTDHYCNNGVLFSKMVVADVKYKHRGSRISTDFGLVEDRFRDAEINSLKSVIAEAAQLVCNQDNYEELTEMLTQAVNRPIEGDVPKFVEEVTGRIGLSKSESDNILVHLDGSELNQLGLQAAVTRLAQDSTKYNKRIELEEAGGKVLQFSDKDWDALKRLAS